MGQSFSNARFYGGNYEFLDRPAGNTEIFYIEPEDRGNECMENLSSIDNEIDEIIDFINADNLYYTWEEEARKIERTKHLVPGRVKDLYRSVKQELKWDKGMLLALYMDEAGFYKPGTLVPVKFDRYTSTSSKLDKFILLLLFTHIIVEAIIEFLEPFVYVIRDDSRAIVYDQTVVHRRLTPREFLDKNFGDKIISSSSLRYVCSDPSQAKLLMQSVLNIAELSRRLQQASADYHTSR